MATVHVFANEPSSPSLSSAKISGFTPDGGNDKDDDTQIRFKLFADIGGGFVQTVGDTGFATYECFRDGHPWPSTGAINIPIKSNFTLNMVASLKATLEFRPRGDDTWKFTFTLELSFSDGTVISRDGSQVVSENQTVNL